MRSFGEHFSEVLEPILALGILRVKRQKRPALDRVAKISIKNEEFVKFLKMD